MSVSQLHALLHRHLAQTGSAVVLHVSMRQQGDVISLAGGISITASDGETRHIGAGEIVLVEDTTGKGHITRSSGDRPRDTIFVPIDWSQPVRRDHHAAGIRAALHRPDRRSPGRERSISHSGGGSLTYVPSALMHRPQTRHSLRRAEDGWVWKFDSEAMGARRFGEPVREYLQAVGCRAALIFGEKSALVSRETASYMSSLMGPRAPVTTSC
jgi:hypothetical protein